MDLNNNNQPSMDLEEQNKTPFTIEGFLRSANLPEKDKEQLVKKYTELLTSPKVGITDENQLSLLTEDRLQKLGLPFGHAAAIAEAAKNFGKKEVTWKEACSIIQKLIADTQLNNYIQDPSRIYSNQYFTPDPEHSFYDQVVKAKIPLTLKGEPDLLLYGLPIKVSAKDIQGAEEIDVMGEEPALRVPTAGLIRFGAEFTRIGSKGNVIVMMGPSGCSKTRTAYELLSIKLGFYFTSSVAGNGGSYDLEAMQGYLENFSKSVDASVRTLEAQRCTLALLLSRLLILCEIRKSLPEDRLPYHWLLLQIKAPFLLKVGTSGEDLFLACSKILRKCSLEVLQEQCQQLLSLFKENLYACLDEAQILLTTCKDEFNGWSGTPRSLLTPLLICLGQFAKLNIVVSGTGLSLKLSLSVIASAFLKSEADMSQYLVVDFGLYNDITVMQNYLQSFIGTIPATEMTTIFNILKGRYRTTAYYLKRVLTAKPTGGLLISVLDQLQYEFATLTDSPLFPQHTLDRLYRGALQPHFNATSILELIYKHTANYYLFGGKFTFLDNETLSLVELGLYPLHHSPTNQLEASIEEPLIAWACYNFFKNKNRPIEQSVLELIGQQVSIAPTTTGLFFELCLIPAVLKYFNCSDLSKHPFFKNFPPETLPEWFVGAHLDRSFSQNNPGRAWIGHATEGRTLVDFLRDPSQCDIFRPEDPARHDAFGKVIDAKNQLHPVIMQFKLRQQISPAEVREALYTTHPRSSYTTHTHKINQAFKKRKMDADSLLQKFQPGTLRILFLFPYDIQKEMNPVVYDSLWADNPGDMLVFLDQSSARELFPESTWRFLHLLKATTLC